MLITRNGASPQIHPEARIADSAAIVGDVRIGAGAYVDHGVVIESGGPPVENRRRGDRLRRQRGPLGGRAGSAGVPGAIVHAGTVLPEEARIGMRHIAAATPDGYLSTADVEHAREVAGADFFEVAFGTAESDQRRLHEDVVATLLDEVHGWRDARLD